MNYDYNKIYYSLNGFYKPEYDDLFPEEIAHKYLKRKEELYNKGKFKEAEYLLFARENVNTMTGFFKDKQGKRYDNRQT